MKQNRLYLFLALVFYATGGAFYQAKAQSGPPQQAVSGTVTDALGPITGVNVVLHNQNNGTFTDREGQYRLMASPTDTLVFTYLGYRTVELPVGNRTHIDVRLQEEATALQEVEVNAGYYTVKERERTGSISRVTAKEIELQPVSNPLAALQGRMPGVNISQTSGVPGAGFSIQIRGQNSIAAGNDPLYIVNGVPFSSQSLGNNQTSTIMPGTVSPLNGINPADIESIEVLKDADATAIYGSRGANGVVLITTKKGKSGKTKVNVHFANSLGRVTRFLTLMDTPQYLSMRREGYANDGITDYPANAYDVNGTWDPNRYTDWQRELIGNTSYRQSVQASISGGSGTTQFLLSGTYQTETDVFPGPGNYSKISINSQMNHRSEDGRFAFDLTANYVADDNSLPATDLTGSALTLAPNAPQLYTEEGDLNWENGTWTNPLSQLESKYLAQSYSLVANTVLSYRLLPDLEVKTSLGYNNIGLEDKRILPSTRFNPARGYDSRNSSLFVNNGNRQSWIVEPQVDWQMKLGRMGLLKVLVGGTFQKQGSKQRTDYAEGFPSNRLIHDLSAATFQTISSNNSTLYKYQAFFGRLNYTWDEKYILNLTGRRDGSSRFGPGNRFADFGALGLVWILSEENLIKTAMPFISFGKLRASYGTSGNDQIGDYQYLDTYSVTGNVYENGTGLRPSRLFNPDFSWEENRKLEVAMEMGFCKDRIFIAASYYNNRSSNQLVGIPLPGTTGFSTIQANLNATVRNTGVEAEIRTLNVSGKKVHWSTGVNFTIPKNKLLEFPDLEGSTYANTYVIGEPLTIRKMYNYTGLDVETGLYTFKDYNSDGAFTTLEDRQYIGDMSPEFFGGLSNQIIFKNWELNFLFQYRSQNRLRSFFGVPGALVNQPTDILDHWTRKGEMAPYQEYSAGNNLDNVMAYMRFVDSNGVLSHTKTLRLKSISLGFRLPTSLMGNNNGLLYLQGQNLWTLTNFKGQDPEQVASYLAPLRQLTVGLQLSF